MNSNDNNYSENSNYPLSQEATDLALGYVRGQQFLDYAHEEVIPRVLASDRFPLREDYSDRDKNIVNTAWGKFKHEYKIF
jgi:hypothetical protein